MSKDPVAALTRLLARLPGIGEKTGARLAYFLWRSPGRYAEELAQAILEMREMVTACSVCGQPTSDDPCAICADKDRDHSLVMVVEEPQDLLAIEKSGAYQGVYHLLGGAISPLAGVGPESLNVSSLIKRVGKGVTEVILATNPSAEGDATAAFLEEEIHRLGGKTKVSRLARGIPAGSRIRYMDPISLEQAVVSRKGN